MLNRRLWWLSLLVSSFAALSWGRSFSAEAVFNEDELGVVRVDYLIAGEYLSADPSFGGPVKIKALPRFSLFALTGFRGNGKEGARSSWDGPDSVELKLNSAEGRFRGDANFLDKPTECPFEYKIEIVPTFEDPLPNPYSLTVREWYPEKIKRLSNGQCIGPANWHFHKQAYYPSSDERDDTELLAELRFYRLNYSHALDHETDPKKREILELFLAVSQQRHAAVKELIKVVDPNVTDPTSPLRRTPLNLAMRLGFLTIAKDLAPKFYKFEKTDLFFHDSDAYGTTRFQRLKFMLDLNPTPEWTELLFKFATENTGAIGGKELYDFVLKYHPASSALQAALVHYLYGALPKGHLGTDYVPLMSLLLKDSNESTRSAFLFKAVEGNAVEMVKLVLTYHPNLETKTMITVPRTGGVVGTKVIRLNALALAIFSERDLLASLLLKEGSDPYTVVELSLTEDAREVNHIPLLVWAAYYIHPSAGADEGKPTILAEIIEREVPLNVKSDGGYTPLDMVVSRMRQVTARYTAVPLSETAKYILGIYRWLSQRGAPLSREEPIPARIINPSSTGSEM